MKITIDLTIAEVNGIKKYLKEIGDCPKPTMKDVAQFYQDESNGLLWMNTAVSDYVVEAYHNRKYQGLDPEAH